MSSINVSTEGGTSFAQRYFWTIGRSFSKIKQLLGKLISWWFFVKQIDKQHSFWLMCLHLYRYCTHISNLIPIYNIYTLFYWAILRDLFAWHRCSPSLSAAQDTEHEALQSASSIFRSNLCPSSKNPSASLYLCWIKDTGGLDFAKTFFLESWSTSVGCIKHSCHWVHWPYLPNPTDSAWNSSGHCGDFATDYAGSSPRLGWAIQQTWALPNELQQEAQWRTSLKFWWAC